MKDIRIDSSWKKVNNITLNRGGKTYDLYKHTIGITGKRWGISPNISLTEKDFKKYTLYSSKFSKALKSRTICITRCEACGPQFSNIIPGSKHTVISPPEGFSEDDKGVWVMGVGEPVKILNYEFRDLNE